MKRGNLIRPKVIKRATSPRGNGKMSVPEMLALLDELIRIENSRHVAFTEKAQRLRAAIEASGN